MQAGISLLEFWELTPRETYQTIEAYVWRDRQNQKKQIAQAWRIAALTRARKLPNLKTVLASGPARPLVGRERVQRREEFQEMTANVDLKALAERMRKMAERKR